MNYSGKQIEEIYQRRMEMVYRLCFVYMKNAYDTEDAVQDTFIRMIEKGPRFTSLEHEKAWLIVTAGNICRNKLKHWSRKTADIESIPVRAPEKERYDDLMAALMQLPDRLKTIVYLAYYEELNSKQIARILKLPSSTVRNRLVKARRLLKKALEDDSDE